MTQQQILRELRQRLKLSREKFAPIIGVSTALLERYESELPNELTEKFSKFSRQQGFDDLAQAFLELQQPADLALQEYPSRTTQTGVSALPTAELLPESVDAHAAKLIAALLSMLDDKHSGHLQKIIEAALEPWLEKKSDKDGNGTQTKTKAKRRA